MRVKFFFHDTTSFPHAILRELPETEFEIPPGTPPLDREKHVIAAFTKLIAEQPSLPQLFAFSSTLGDPPNGCVIAAEIIHDAPRQPRRLKWLYTPLDHQLASAIQIQSNASRQQ